MRPILHARRPPLNAIVKQPVTAITPTGAGRHCGLDTKEDNDERHC
jgi:hypothetical protein